MKSNYWLSILGCFVPLLVACNTLKNNTDNAECIDSTDQITCTKTVVRNQPNNQPFYSTEQQQRELSMGSGNNAPQQFVPQFHHKLLTDYIEQLASQLTDSITVSSALTPIAIASFVSFDKNLDQAGPIGNQIAELLYSELQLFGLVMLDYKTTESIRVTRSGDFIFDRSPKYKGLSGVNIDYVLSGTLISVRRGLLVNARIVSTRSKQVIAATKLLIPNFALP